jgi:hypothetical protein
MPAPVNIALPTVMGTSQVGRTLLASTGSWTNSPTGFAYQWSSSAGGAISGATSSSYTPVATDVGKALFVSVTATNSSGSSAPKTSTASQPVIGIPPVNTLLPSISGTLRVGATLTASPGAWINNPTSYSYQWNNSASGSIAGATAATYVLQPSDVGDMLTVSVIATNSGGSSASETSAATGAIAVAAAAPVNTALPTISGTAQVGQTLTATNGAWTNNPTSFTYQWNRAGTPMGGATASTYVPIAADVGSPLTVSVVATNSSGASSAATSAATAAVVSGWADGSAGAPSGLPQYPSLLSGYGSNRPQWNVASVDYHVGIPDGAALVDWRTISDPQLSVNLSTGLLRVDRKSGGSYTFQNVDFSLGIGAILYNASGGAASFTCVNCKFALPASGSQQYGASYSVLDQNAANMTVMNCYFDGTNMTSMTAFISTGGSLTFEYNWCLHSKEQIINFNPNIANKTLVYKYNLIDDSVISSGSHQNYLQNYSTTSVPMSFDIEFNTTYQKTAGGAEGFQFYCNASTGFTLVNPIFTNNTMISRPVSGTVSMSYMNHGNDHTNSNISGTGQNKNNYFDRSGAYGAYYPGSFTQALGWSSSGNIDMNTGAIITPA